MNSFLKVMFYFSYNLVFQVKLFSFQRCNFRIFRSFSFEGPKLILNVLTQCCHLSI